MTIEITPLPLGTTLRMVFTGCHSDERLLNDHAYLAPKIEQLVKDVGFVPISCAGVDFDSAGCSLVWCLAESHIALHSWPELDATVVLELSVCDYLRSNRERTRMLADALVKLFIPRRFMTEECSMVPRFSQVSASGNSLHIDVEALLLTERTEYQQLEIFQTSSFGKVMALDGVVQTTEFDNAWHHEPLIQVPLLVHPSPKTVLISGGSDGGMLNQALLHPSVERIILCEVDRQVIDAARIHFSKVNHGSFDDDRVHIYSESINSFLNKEKETYDVIALNRLTKSDSAKSKSGDEFFERLSSRLAKGGFLSVLAGSFTSFSPDLPSIFRSISSVLETTLPYTHFVPSDASERAFFLCSRGLQELPDAELLDNRIRERDLEGRLQLLDGSRLHALFSLPPLYRHFLQSNQVMVQDL